MNVKFKMPKFGRELTRKGWIKELLLTTWKSRARLTPEGKAALTPENLLLLSVKTFASA